MKKFGAHIIISFFSLMVGVFIASSCDNYIYSLLFVLPVLYSIICIACAELWDEIPQNLSITLITVLFFIRMVLSPLLMVLGQYSTTITRGIADNTTPAILLISYEAISVFAYLKHLSNKDKGKILINTQNVEYKINKKYTLIVLLIFGIVLVCNRITPQLLSGYRTVFDMDDELFTNYEDAQIVDQFGTSFVSKLSLVLGQYATRLALILIPAYIIVRLSEKKNFLKRVISLMFCFAPLFFIGGAIAKSLIYIICLGFIYNFVWSNKSNLRYRSNSTINGRSMLILFLGAIAAFSWWVYKSDADAAMQLFCRRFSAYFSGVNVVSGVFNMPDDFEYKIRYFLYDIFMTIPFSGTIFGRMHEDIQPFFNDFNGSYGQIPPTIGMSYYYFGALLSPVYSLIFTKVSYVAARKIKQKEIVNSIQYIRLLITVFYFAMGIMMYNINITMTNFYGLILPMLIFERIAYKQVK